MSKLSDYRAKYRARPKPTGVRGRQLAKIVHAYRCQHIANNDKQSRVELKALLEAEQPDQHNAHPRLALVRTFVGGTAPRLAQLARVIDAGFSHGMSPVEFKKAIQKYKGVSRFLKRFDKSHKPLPSAGERLKTWLEQKLKISQPVSTISELKLPIGNPALLIVRANSDGRLQLGILETLTDEMLSHVAKMPPISKRISTKPRRR